jgi:DNA sulfur modification protein DndB
MGFLTINRGDLIALDGQHRLVAFRDVMLAGGQLGKFADKVGDDEVCVLFIEHEDAQKTRRIFNKVNRNAKPTGRSDNIVTSEDDGFAIITRRLLDRGRNAPLASRIVNGENVEMVNWTSNTLSQRANKLTTLSAVYETVKDVLSDAGYTDFSEKDSPVAPDDSTLDSAYEVASLFWENLLTMGPLATAIADPSSIPDVRFSGSDRSTLLLRPVGQIALVRGLVLAGQYAKGKLSRLELIRRAEQIDWSASGTSMWRDVILRPDGRMIARTESYALAGRLLAYLIAADYTTEKEKHDLWVNWNEARGHDPHASVEGLDQHEIPEDLPRPIGDA